MQANPRRHLVAVLAGVLALGMAGCDDETRTVVEAGGPGGPDEEVQDNLQASSNFPTIFLPAGFRIEKVVEGLTFPTALTFDDQGRMFVVEAGGAFLEEPPPVRLLRIEGGTPVEVARFDSTQVRAAAVGLTFHNGSFFMSHRDPQDRTGAVSRFTPGGQMTKILTGILDSQAEHQVNDIKMGPGGRMFLASGPAGNAAVVGLDLAPFIALSPMLHTTPCQDIVLRGVNYRTPDFRTEDPSDVVETGAYVPFGTATTPGQRIPGTKKCGGSILTFDPNNAEATVRPFVSGLRNPIGITFRGNEMFVTENGYDVRGSRPFNDNFDATYRVVENRFYGYPDFSRGTFELISEPKYDVPNSLQAPQFVRGQPVGKDPILPVIDLAASGLQRPDPSLVAGLHPINSSPSGIDASPASFGSFGGHLFVAEWGDLAPPTNPLRNLPVGSRITRIAPGSNRVEPFIRNRMRGPASEQGAKGMGLERPFYVKFGPDGAMYIVDYGISRPNRPDAGPGDDPYEFVPNTGIIWKVTRS